MGNNKNEEVLEREESIGQKGLNSTQSTVRLILKKESVGFNSSKNYSKHNADLSTIGGFFNVSSFDLDNLKSSSDRNN